MRLKMEAIQRGFEGLKMKRAEKTVDAREEAKEVGLMNVFKKQVCRCVFFESLTLCDCLVAVVCASV